MEEENTKKMKSCPFCGTSINSNACPECNILIEEDDYKIGFKKEVEENTELEKKKENKKEEEEEEYDWREHKR
jgi:hypothetical protein